MLLKEPNKNLTFISGSNSKLSYCSEKHRAFDRNIRIVFLVHQFLRFPSWSYRLPKVKKNTYVGTLLNVQILLVTKKKQGDLKKKK